MAIHKITVTRSGIPFSVVTVLQGPRGLAGGAWAVKTSSFTAANLGQYIATATLTVTDPTPSAGAVFEVLVRAGTATVGGVAYSIAGTSITRVYNSGAWASYVNQQITGTGLLSATSGVLDTPSTLSDRVAADAANLRSQLDLDSNYLPLAGGTMAGGILLSSGDLTIANFSNIYMEGADSVFSLVGAINFFTTPYTLSFAAPVLTANRFINLPDATGTVNVSSRDDGTPDTFNATSYTFGTGAAAAFRTALGAGTTGDALFLAASAATANVALGKTVVIKQLTETLTNADFSTPNHGTRALATTFGNDNELFLSVNANTIYKLDFHFPCGWGNDGLNGQLSLPSLAYVLNAGHGFQVGLSNAAPTFIASSGTTIALSTNATSNSNIRTIAGSIIFATGATGGTMRFQWCKNATAANSNSIVYKGSVMLLEAIGTYPA